MQAPVAFTGPHSCVTKRLILIHAADRPVAPVKRNVIT